MYRCGYCKESTPCRQTRLVVTGYRQIEDKSTHQIRQEVAKETLACERCYKKENKKLS